MKKIIIGGIIAIVLITGGYLFLTKPASTNSIQGDDYYEQLKKQCRSSEEERSCCLASVEYMERNTVTLEPDKGCPEGYAGNMMKCVSSYRWCELDEVDKPNNTASE